MRLAAAAILLPALYFSASAEASFMRHPPTLFGVQTVAPDTVKGGGQEYSDRRRKAHVRATRRAVKAQAIITCDRQGCGHQEMSSVSYAGVFEGVGIAPARGASRSLSGVVAPLAAKAREIVSACGSRVISGVRHTRVRGSGRLSLHASGRAVDLQGNPSCIYAHLKDWPGGYSVDYHSVRCGRTRCPHVHVSYSPNGREWGVRFTHYGSKRKARRAYARVQ